MSENDIHVKMCEVRTAGQSSILRTILGSCVGIGILWPEREQCALAHCLLPESSTPSVQPSAKYVTDAVPWLLRLLGADLEEYGQLRAVLAGGACMMNQVKPAPYGLIGEQNVLVAQRMLAEAGIHVIHADVGGISGRQLSIDCATQRYEIRTFERIH